MRLFIVLLSILSGSGLWNCSLAWCGAAEDGPKASISAVLYDFGTVIPGKKVSPVFYLKNEGAAVLRIEKVDLIGKHTELKAKKTIPPGDTGRIFITLETSELLGPVESRAIIHTNDPDKPQIELKIVGQVKPRAVEVRPMKALFFAVFQGERDEKELTIINNEDKPLEIIGVESKSSRFKVHLEKVKEGKEYKLVGKVGSGLSPGKTRDKVLVFTDNPDFAEIPIYVHVFVKDEVYLFPDSVSLGKIDLNYLKGLLKKKPGVKDLLTQTILVKRRPGKGENFQIKLENSLPFLQIKKEPEKNSETYRLDITPIPEKLKRGKINTFIKVKTTDKEVPELKIPVVGEII